MELEAKHGQGDCKCDHYREKFPDCACERESVSTYSPGPVADSEVLVRAIFRQQPIDQDGRMKPAYFRRDPESRGFSVDRVLMMGAASLKSSKINDIRYTGHLQFIATCAKEVRALLESEKRLFCIYDSGTLANNFHADICQNLHFGSSTPNRKVRMMKIAWELRSTFQVPQSIPPTSLT
ncbi:MAG: hypothetical protein OXE48_10220 [Gammaproteobacteria bacterium]|nr:hypothetical protein [Gammaproteobacteria bacterium]